MKRIQVLHKNGQLNVKTVLFSDETIDQEEIGLFNSKLITGMMRPTVLKSNKILYTASEGVSLADYISNGISEKDFYIIFAQVMEVLKKLSYHNLKLNSLVLDISYAFINKDTKIVSFLYQPIKSNHNNTLIFPFLYSLIDNANINDGGASVMELRNMMQKIQFFTPEVFENYIIQVCPEAYKKVRRLPNGQSEMLHSSNMQPNDTYKEDAEELTSLMQSENNNVTTNEELTGLLVEPETGLLNENMISNLSCTPGSAFVLQLTGKNLSEDDEMGTMCLDVEGTMLLSKSAPEYIQSAYLIRNKSGEKILISKTDFKIGKDPRNVDFAISDNGAVSRQHATIVNKNGQYFIVDNKSTNKTYINGDMIEPNLERKIINGDSILLGNEGFDFVIEEKEKI